MIEIIAITVVGVLGFFSGWKTREEVAVQRMSKLLGEFQTDDQENTIKIVIEKHNDVYFVYNMNDKSFMAQGNTRKELEGVLADKYPGKKFAASTSNLADMGFI